MFIRRFLGFLIPAVILCLLIGTTALAAVTIKTWDQPGTDPLSKITEMIQKGFEKLYPDIKVERTVIPGKPGENRLAFTSAMAGGSGPDAYHAAHFPTIPVWIDQGFAMDITEMYKAWPDSKNVLPAALQAAMKNGRIYGVPNSYYVMMLAYRRDLFKNAGLAGPPRNWNELATFAQKLTDPRKNRYGYAILGMDWASWYWENFVWQAGGEVTEKLPDGKCKIRFTEEPAIKALQFYKDLKWKYKVVQSDVLQAYDANVRDLVQGTAAMYMLAIDQYPGLLSQGLKPEQIGFATLPAGPTGIKAAQVGGAYWIVNPALAKNKAKLDAVWKYVTYMSSKDTFLKTYELQADAGVLFPPKMPYFSGISISKYFKEVPEDIAEEVNDSLAHGKMEYYFKDRIEPYLAKPIQAVLLDQKADPKAVLEECAKRVLQDIPNTTR